MSAWATPALWLAPTMARRASSCSSSVDIPAQLMNASTSPGPASRGGVRGGRWAMISRGAGPLGCLAAGGSVRPGSPLEAHPVSNSPNTADSPAHATSDHRAVFMAPHLLVRDLSVSRDLRYGPILRTRSRSASHPLLDSRLQSDRMARVFFSQRLERRFKCG